MVFSNSLNFKRNIISAKPSSADGWESKKKLIFELIGERGHEFFDIRVFPEHDFSAKTIDRFYKKIKIDIVIGQFCIII